MAAKHTVRIIPHERSISVPEDLPVLAAAQLAGLPLPHSCRSGRCGSCRARLLRGRVEYAAGPPPGLTAQECDAGYVLLCQALARSDLLIEAHAVQSVAEAQIKTLPARIVRRVPLAADVMQLIVRVPAVEALEFQAGQYLDVLLAGGQRRSYSVANAPQAGSQFELHVQRVPGGLFSEALFGGLREGSLLNVEGPLGRFIYREGPEPVIFVAGGTGFAPIKAMLGQALAAASGRALRLYWGARRREGLYEEALVREWAGRHARLSVHLVLSEETAAVAHRHGQVHEAVLADHPDLSPFVIYAAGPPAMIAAIARDFPGRGAQAQCLFLDSFDYAAAP